MSIAWLKRKMLFSAAAEMNTGFEKIDMDNMFI